MKKKSDKPKTPYEFNLNYNSDDQCFHCCLKGNKYSIFAKGGTISELLINFIALVDFEVTSKKLDEKISSSRF